MLWKCINVFVFGVGIVCAVQIMAIVHFAKKVSLDTLPLEQRVPQAALRVLFAGDSTAVGTGTSTNTKSTAGWFAQEFPRADIENISQNGLRLEGLRNKLAGLQGKQYDLAILQIGANDILYFTPISKIKQQQAEVVHLAKKVAREVIILHSGDMGKAPLFFWPFTAIYTWRTLKVRDIYLYNQDNRVKYVDIFQLEKNIKNMRSLYAADQLHLNDEGYHTWYQFIRTQLSYK